MLRGQYLGSTRKRSTFKCWTKQTVGNKMHIAWRGVTLTLSFLFLNFVSAGGTMKAFKTRHDNMHKRYRQCAETSYADSDVKDDKGWTPRITLTNDTTSIDVSPTQQRSGFADN